MPWRVIRSLLRLHRYHYHHQQICRCMFQGFELVTYCWLCNPKAKAGSSQEDDHLGQMVSINGLTLFPVDVLARGKYSAKYFDGSGKLLKLNVVASSIARMLQLRYPLQPENEPEILVGMLSRMLLLRPEDRDSARELLNHPWLRDC
ncbi:hypothetical protein EDD18DRAFT_1204038 [Armillaria luteobubalina]|uniref:non-specific serine/threonine protein kinase n=1 Tax=Armillaria luteobubalina TaxID=153913 RepID=A0AA39PC06_9AGAR|nr:hypothetical protein EDD18DRAFT_1204038 [Armillaria luteobubalina]